MSCCLHCYSYPLLKNKFTATEIQIQNMSPLAGCLCVSVAGWIFPLRADQKTLVLTSVLNADSSIM